MNLKNAFASVIISTIFVVSSAWSAWAFPVEGTPAAAPFAKSCQSQPLEDSQRDLKSNKANSQSDTKNQDLAAQKADKGNKAANVPKTTYKPSEQDMEDALNMLDKAVILVKTEAREKAKPGKITNDAFKGMMMLLEDSKVDSNIFNDIDEDSTPEAANKALRSQFTEAAKRYPNLMKDQKLTIAALRGIMYATGDPYTVYMDPEEYKNLNEQMSGGNFGGVGIVMQLSGKETDPKKDRVLVIQRVMDKGPAASVGLRANDEIREISGKSTYGMSLVECSKLLRGEPNSKVVLTIRRPSSGHIFKTTLTREIIHVDSLKSEVLEKDGVKIGYLALTIFGESTGSEIEAAMREKKKKNCQAYIIDVRFNSGGYVSAAVDVCSQFVKTGSRIVSIVNGKGDEQVIYSHPSLHSSQKPLIVMINDSSASASEITAGAIRDLKRGRLLGVKSFGKGSVQKVFPYQFPRDKTSAFKITTAHYHTPAGHDLHKAGLKPDIELDKMEPELYLDHAKDTQLQKALETIKAMVDEQEANPKPHSGSTLADGTILVNSVVEETQYIEEALKEAKPYSIVERDSDVHGPNILDVVRVSDSKGLEHTFKFTLTPAFEH